MTKLHVHELAGLKPDVLATYLAALGVMRLLATQEKGDPNVRGFWRNECFVLVSDLDWNAIERFFLEEYAPTPILAPWNIEGGFFSLKPSDATVDEGDETLNASEISNSDESPGVPNDEMSNDDEESDEMDRAVGDPRLERFAGSAALRLTSFRRAIEIARSAISKDLRSAEENARLARAEESRCTDAEVTAGSASERAKYEEAQAILENAKSAAARLKVEVDARKAAIKGAPKDALEREELKQARERFDQAKETEKAARKTAQDIKKELKQAEKLAKGNKQTKERIKAAKEETRAAKKRFGEIQKKTKGQLIADIRARWGVESREWIDAAIALDEEGEVGFTSLFGSGGNDGRMEFTKNLRYHLEALINIDTGAARENAAARFRSAILGYPTDLLEDKAVGQFFPGRAGGTNMGTGFFGGSGVNPWEFVLMLEGAVGLVAGMSRRGDVEKARVSSPFWVEGASAGFGSASQREGSPRGEQWLPLWSQPICYEEFVELVREGRAQVGGRQTTRAADLVRATARLGLARGIDSLQRFAYLKRNGQANLAVSTGRFRVASRSHQELLDDVAPWINRLVWYSGDKNASSSLGVIARRVEEALFAVCRQDAPHRLWRDLLIALGEAELVLLRAGKSPARQPLPPLSSGWLKAVDEDTAEGRTELRLALALASQHRPLKQPTGPLEDSVRRHFLPLKDSGRFKLDVEGRVERDPEHVCFGRDLVTDAIALLERRSLWARSSNNKREWAHRLPLEAVAGCEATLEEVGGWVRGQVCDETVLGLVRPFLALDWTDVVQRGTVIPAERQGVPDPFQMLFRLAHLPFDLPLYTADGRVEAEIAVHLDPEPLRRLAAGDFDGALKVAVRRLEASGLRPVFHRGVAASGFARRLAASLAFPIGRYGAARAASLICKPYDDKDVEELSSSETEET